jgi:hypothetical protein
MTITRTTLLDLPIITSGTETGVWGDITNNGLTQYLDIAIAGMVSLTSSDFTAGALTIALTEGTSGATNIANSSAQYATIKVSSLATNSTITAPASNRSYRIVNLDSTYNLTIKASGQTGITFLPGQTGVVAFTGTDYEVVGVVNAASSTDNAVPRFDGTTGQILQTSSVVIDDSGNLTTAGLNTSGAVVFNDAGADVDFRVESDTVENALFVDGATGNIGIGTGTPTSNRRLDAVISADASAGIRVVNSNAGTATSSNTSYNNGTSSHEFGILGTNYSTYGVLAASDAYIYASNNQNIAFGADGVNSIIKFGTGAGITERMRIDSSGNVGIGTTSPANKLHVAGGKLQITGATGGGAGGGYLSGETASEFHIVSEDYTGTGYADIVFDSGNGSGSSYLERMRIDSSGNLLVGTTSINGSSSNTVDIVGGNFKTFSNSGSIAGSTTATVLTLSSSVLGVYIVQANFGSQANEIYTGMLIIAANANSFRIVTNGSGTNSVMTLSGANVQLANAIGSALDFTASAIFIGS